jgi:hypothetical protein
MLHYHAQEYLSIEMHGSLKETLTKFFNIERVSDIPVCEIEQFWAYSETKKKGWRPAHWWPWTQKSTNHKFNTKNTLKVLTSKRGLCCVELCQHWSGKTKVNLQGPHWRALSYGYWQYSIWNYVHSSSDYATTKSYKGDSLHRSF